jgi:hypothetical protein
MTVYDIKMEFPIFNIPNLNEVLEQYNSDYRVVDIIENFHHLEIMRAMAQIDGADFLILKRYTDERETFFVIYEIGY